MIVLSGGAIAVVDAGGHVVALERLDGTFAAGADISVGKARTAALFKKPTSFFDDVINKGRTAMAGLPPQPDFTPLQGGVPIVVDGQVIGAVGVSGAMSAKQDDEIATLAAAAVEPTIAGTAPATPAATSVFEHDQVEAAFAKGEPLLEVPARCAWRRRGAPVGDRRGLCARRQRDAGHRRHRRRSQGHRARPDPRLHDRRRRRASAR